MDDGHTEAYSHSEGESGDDRKKAGEAGKGHQSAAEAWEHEHHTGHHKDDAEESRPSGPAAACDGQIHRGRRNPDAGGWANAPGNGRAG